MLVQAKILRKQQRYICLKIRDTMPTFPKQTLLTQLKAAVQETINAVQSLSDADTELLNTQPGYHQWSGAQVLEHLNIYNRAYLPAIETRLKNTSKNQAEFKSGWLGNYFTKVMQPGVAGEVTNKMSAPKDARPIEKLNAGKVVSDFLAGQHQLLQLLEKAVSSDLDVRVPTSISKLIRLKAGDTLRFLVAHQQRHLAQFTRTLDAIR